MRGVGSFLMRSFSSLREMRLCSAAICLKFEPALADNFKKLDSCRLNQISL